MCQLKLIVHIELSLLFASTIVARPNIYYASQRRIPIHIANFETAAYNITNLIRTAVFLRDDVMEGKGIRRLHLLPGPVQPLMGLITEFIGKSPLHQIYEKDENDEDENSSIKPKEESFPNKVLTISNSGW
ncbi:uncharacterized protein LOC115626201 [Scaptodrosophila lebanonensis]|uniref:Uncharacterized protein LOC115626201 n=1 Tax=Drosophila lebanonensis TaxID=7225 RepID=A0A6J2TMT7_DROLE|nr:uncharacterized protein LOC115626201 [Scaptodrosophila lebanonensis]